MILVTTGTNGAPFDRLLRALENVDIGEPMVVQHGPSAVRPRGAECIEFMGFAELAERVRAARLVISHAGAGSVLISLINGRRPIVVPRRAAFGEAVDDHQLPFARRLNAEGLVTLVEDLADLVETMFSASARAGIEYGGGPLERELAAYIDAASDRAAP